MYARNLNIPDARFDYSTQFSPAVSALGGNGGLNPLDQIGRPVSHYHVLEKLGSGGMGVVCKAADDPVGLKHAIGRGLLSYVAFVYVPSPYKATGISCVVLLAYLYSLLRMKRPPKM